MIPYTYHWLTLEKKVILCYTGERGINFKFQILKQY